MKEKLAISDRGTDSQELYHTVGGFAVTSMGHIPKIAERFTAGGWDFEIGSMDRNRVDEVLASPHSQKQVIKDGACE